MFVSNGSCSLTVCDVVRESVFNTSVLIGAFFVLMNERLDYLRKSRFDLYVRFPKVIQRKCMEDI